MAAEATNNAMGGTKDDSTTGDGSNTTINTTSDVVAALGGGPDLESFVAAAQRALLDDDSDDSPENWCRVEVGFCASLKNFLASRTDATARSDGTVLVRVQAFVEPSNWQKADHVSSGGTSMTFVRDPPAEEHHPLANAPTLALKLIRREALEELRSDALGRTTNTNSTAAPEATGPGSGDRDAGRRILRLAVGWADGKKNRNDNEDAVAVVCGDDDVLSTRDATTRFVQSRVSVGIEHDDDEKRGRIRSLELRSPSLATPISGVRPRGTGGTFCKVVLPQALTNAVASERR